MTTDRKKEIVGLFLGVAFLLYTLFTAPPEDISLSAWKTIGVTLLMATWWMLEAIPIAVTALVPLVLFPALGIMTAKDVAPNYAQDLIWLFVGGFALAYAMETWNRITSYNVCYTKLLRLEHRRRRDLRAARDLGGPGRRRAPALDRDPGCARRFARVLAAGGDPAERDLV